MRVYGNGVPAPFEVYRTNGKAEVRLRENVVSIDDNLFEYDEYSIKNLPDSDNLVEDIQTRFDEWLATGKALERIPNSSEAYHTEQQHMTELADLVELVYQDDLEVIG